MARLMVVDDSQVMRRIIANMIHQHTGHIVVAEAENGQDAVEKYREFLPDLVTMDMTMPVMDGCEAVKQIIGEFPAAKIVMVSSVNERSKVIAAIQCGAVSFLLKPVGGFKLRELADRILADSASTCPR